MKILHLLIFILLFGAGYSMADTKYEYQITGTVSKKGGGPLEGVTVLLKGKDVSALTDEDGTFEIVSPVAIRMKAAQKQTLAFKLHGNAIRFSLVEGNLSGNVSIFCGNGRRIASIDFSNLNPMTEQITLPQLSSGLNIVRVIINNNVYTCQLVRLGNELHLTNRNTASRTDDIFSLAKITDSEAIDSLIATKENFKESVTPINSYNLSDISIEMDSIVEESEIAWGRKENPTDHCTVGSLPEYSALNKANSKLPDPFMKLDGTRITSKSEWACQRELLYRQLIKYIYGEKPIPPKEAVSGTVSTQSISVKVKDGQKECSFTATVKMNGATQPAPAIIQYASGASAPSGVATISFSPKEVSGGSGDKEGPFFDFYGKRHEAGYLVAWACQVSRIIDVLEQNPSIIDPSRIAVTGCSRFGKGAFVAGVLDNRIALTIPVESGIGGTVGLRLVEQLDTQGEWPYHAISYVRWFSEVALGKFTSGNNAGADNTDRLPVDMHSAMALIAPRGLYIVDNPSGTYAGLDAKSAWVTASIGKKIFEALGVGDHFSCVGASGNHCQWRNKYDASMNAMVDKFLKGNNSANTGEVSTDLGNKPNPEQYIDWTVPTLDGEL